MDKHVLKAIGKCIIFGFFWTIILFGIALLITNNKRYELKDVLFIEGMLFVIGGVLSSVGGNPIGLSLQGLGQQNSQYVANSNLEVTKMENDKTKNIKTTLSTGLNSISLIFGGVLTIIINFII